MIETKVNASKVPSFQGVRIRQKDFSPNANFTPLIIPGLVGKSTCTSQDRLPIARFVNELEGFEPTENEMLFAEYTYENISGNLRRYLDWQYFDPDYDCKWHVGLSFELLCEIYSRTALLRSIRDRRISRLPNVTLNFLISQRVAKRFTYSEIEASESFSSFYDLGVDGSIRRFWLFGTYQFNGYLMPQIIGGEVNGVRIFRNISDDSPFILKVAKGVRKSV